MATENKTKKPKTFGCPSLGRNADGTHQLPKRKANGKNSPVVGIDTHNPIAGDNAKQIQLHLKFFNMPNIDLRDPEQVANRLSEYFTLYAEADYKPTVSGMALALNGMSRQNLIGIVKDLPVGGRGNYSTLPSESTVLIKKAYSFLETNWENNMQQGKINPVSGIFLAKNNFDYADRTEYVVSPGKNVEDYSAADIRARYIEPEPPKKLTD